MKAGGVVEKKDYMRICVLLYNTDNKQQSSLYLIPRQHTVVSLATISA